MYKGRYKNGLKYGKWIFWNENGNKISEGYFKDGHMDGKWIFFHPNGKKHEEGFFLCIVILQFGMVNIIHGSVMANTNLLGDLIMVKKRACGASGIRKFQAQGSYLEVSKNQNGKYLMLRQLKY